MNDSDVVDDDVEEQEDFNDIDSDDDVDDDDDEGDDNVSFSQNYRFRSGDIPAGPVMAFFCSIATIIN